MTQTNMAVNGGAPTAPAVPTRKEKVDMLKSLFEMPSIQDQFANTMQESAASFMASVIDLFNSDGNLQECEPKEVVMQALKAAVLKLPINKSLGFAYLVPYNTKIKTSQGDKWVKVPQFQLGYKGYVQLAYRTGQYQVLHADAVYKGEYRSANKLTGEFDLNGARQSDEVIGYFAYFRMKSGLEKTLFMTKERVVSHAQRFSKMWNKEKNMFTGAWASDFDSMAVKTVLRGLLSKWGTLSVEMANAMDQEDVEDQVQQEIAANANSKTMQFDTPQTQLQRESSETAPEYGRVVEYGSFNNNGPDF